MMQIRYRNEEHIKIVGIEITSLRKKKIKKKRQHQLVYKSINEFGYAINDNKINDTTEGKKSTERDLKSE